MWPYCGEHTTWESEASALVLVGYVATAVPSYHHPAPPFSASSRTQSSLPHAIWAPGFVRTAPHNSWTGQTSLVGVFAKCVNFAPPPSPPLSLSLSLTHSSLWLVTLTTDTRPHPLHSGSPGFARSEEMSTTARWTSSTFRWVNSSPHNAFALSICLDPLE